MADLMTRILLNDKQFSDTLDKSKRQVNGFEKVGGVATGMITKMAGAFGIAATATESFPKGHRFHAGEYRPVQLRDGTGEGRCGLLFRFSRDGRLQQHAERF